MFFENILNCVSSKNNNIQRVVNNFVTR